MDDLPMTATDRPSPHRTRPLTLLSAACACCMLGGCGETNAQGSRAGIIGIPGWRSGPAQGAPGRQGGPAGGEVAARAAYLADREREEEQQREALRNERGLGPANVHTDGGLTADQAWGACYDDAVHKTNERNERCKKKD